MTIILFLYNAHIVQISSIILRLFEQTSVLVITILPLISFRKNSIFPFLSIIPSFYTLYFYSSQTDQGDDSGQQDGDNKKGDLLYSHTSAHT